ncbi:unnamed protein product [Cercospora beticola]|nr:unnamed protein product [Cercospora beticola]
MPSKKRKASVGAGAVTAPRKTKVPRAPEQAPPLVASTRVTRLMKLDSVRQAVFTTAELLENIILLLPVRSIYSAYRVCNQWKALVDTSKAVKEKLFLLPSTPKQKWKFEKKPFSGWMGIDSIKVSLASDDMALSKILAPLYQRDFPIVLEPVKLHPLLTPVDDCEFMNHRLLGNGAETAKLSAGKNGRTLAAFLNTPSTTPAALLKSNPVLDAPITDPPCKFVKVNQTWTVSWRRDQTRSQGSSVGRIEHAIGSDMGITLRDVIASLHQPGKCYGSSIPWGYNQPRATLEEAFRGFTEYELVRVNDHITIHMPSQVVPSQEEWQMVK